MKFLTRNIVGNTHWAKARRAGAALLLAGACVAPFQKAASVEPTPARVALPSAYELAPAVPATHWNSDIQQCQAFAPVGAAGCQTCGTACDTSGTGNGFSPFAQGEYAAHDRLPHVSEYRLRVDDSLEFIYRLTREETTRPYQLNVGDEIRVESVLDDKLDRNLVIQPDGTITLRLLGQVRATRKTVTQLRDELEQLYTQYYKNNNVVAISVTPIKVNTKLEDLRATVDARAGSGGQNRQAKVTPDGTVALPAVGSVRAQGLTLGELKHELDERYAEKVEGMEVIPVLTQRAPRYVYVLGEVHVPGRFTLEGPTTVMQAIAMAGSWNVGAQLQQVVVFRRNDDWRLMATMLDLRAALRGKTTCAGDEIWLNDSDVIVLPKSSILATDDFINLVFTRGVFGVVPFSTSYQFNTFASLSHL